MNPKQDVEQQEVPAQQEYNWRDDWNALIAGACGILAVTGATEWATEPVVLPRAATMVSSVTLGTLYFAGRARRVRRAMNEAAASNPQNDSQSKAV
jgi:hypothetical protein